MENNEEKAKAQHTTGKHPEPSDNVQSDIETVTPDTENGGLDDVNKHESQEKKEQQVNDEQEDKQQGSEQLDDAGQGPEQEVSDDEDSDRQEDDQSDADQAGDDDARGGVETVSP